MERQVWRLIAHHRDSELAIKRCKKASQIAIGWGKIGDLSRHSADAFARQSARPIWAQQFRSRR